MIPSNKAIPAIKILLTNFSNPREAIFSDLPNDLSPAPILAIVLLKPSLTESGKNLPINLAVDLIPDTNKPNVF